MLRQHPFYSVFTALSSMKPQNRLVEFANSSFGFWTCFLGGLGGEGGDDDDIVTQTPRRISPEEPFHSVFTVLS